MAYNYDYKSPEDTITLEEYIDCKSDYDMSYHNTSFVDKYDGKEYDVYNITSDYIDELRSDEYSVLITLTEAQYSKYKYRPKLLCFDLYGSTELHFIILLINDMYSCKQFTKRKIRLPSVVMMENLTTQLLNASKQIMDEYKKNFI